MEDKSTVTIFIDDEEKPVASFKAPVNFELDTRKLVDGDHVMRIVSKDTRGIEGVRTIPFVVRNGPSIDVVGIKNNSVVDGVLPILINAYSKGDQKKFLIQSSETPRHVPSWLWVLIIAFIGWALFYSLAFLFPG